MTLDWKQFEKAVAAFLQALDPAAKVTHDKLIPDSDTGLPRQRDVWIETQFGGHLGITILVSCKRKKARLSQLDIDAFVGELRSSGANKGVLYAYNGFTQPALAKAEKLGVSCCVLYEDRPPEIPEVLAFAGYCFREKVRLSVNGLPKGKRYTWREILEVEAPGSGSDVPAVKLLAQRFREARLTTEVFTGLVRPGRRAEISGTIEHLGFTVTLVLETEWVTYRAKLGAVEIQDSHFGLVLIQAP